MTINSEFIKTALMLDYRFKRRCDMIATEAGAYASDFLAITSDRKKLIEVEVKISRSDLLADFKKEKHQIYNGTAICPYTKKIVECNHIPHEFYFCVPRHLENDALELVKNSKYGVIRCDYSSSGKVSTGHTTIIKRAKKLHNRPIKEIVVHTLVNRMVSELVNFRQKKINEFINQ